jgi:hypothetical protein
VAKMLGTNCHQKHGNQNALKKKATPSIEVYMRIHTHTHTPVSVYVGIYICIQRERERVRHTHRLVLLRICLI